MILCMVFRTLRQSLIQKVTKSAAIIVDMAMQVMDSNGDFSYLKIRATGQALENKRRNENVNEVLRPPPQPLLREEPIAPYHQSVPRIESEYEDRETKKAANPFGSESPEQKAARQRKEADDDIRRFKEERQRQMMAKHMEKKRDLQMLRNYDPWGRPGHGAPLGPEQEDQRKRKFQETGDNISGRGGRLQNATEEFQGLALNRPGHGAPLRTESGRLITQLPGDPALRFRDAAAGRRGRDPAETLRYRNPDGQSYARELDLHIQQQVQQREIERAHELREELNTLQYDPFGKPGSGAPNQPLPPLPQHNQVNLQNPQLRHRRQEAADLAETYGSQPRQSNSSGWDPVDDYSGTAMRQQLHHDATAAQWYQRRDPMETQSAPNAHQQHLNEHPMSHHDQSHAPHVSDQLAAYNPFGRPGAGAPLRSRDGQLIPSVFGATAKFEEAPGEKHRRVEAAKTYSQELERGVMEQSVNKRLEVQQRRAPAQVDLPIAEQLARGTVGKPSRDPRTGVLLDQRLSSTDITQQTRHQMLPELHQASHGVSGSDLERAADERAAARRIDRAREIHEADRHAEAFGRMFGRPGGGAPKSEGARRTNLERVLHNRDEMRSGYHQSAMDPRFPIGSSHSKGYEAPTDNYAVQTSYSLVTPYAVHNQE